MEIIDIASRTLRLVQQEELTAALDINKNTNVIAYN